MAPPRSQEALDSYTSEYNDFLAKLTAYHQKRGTHLDVDPRVGNKHVDLLRLFNAVVERGGYDKVCDEKLGWRKLGQDFNLGSNNLPALAFSLKSAYYKNLAAYEISTIHGKEPPPREILEDVTAKGGSLLARTVENYRPTPRRETGGLAGEQSDGSGDDGTPVRDQVGSEDTPGSGGRVTRGLRQAPPQRVLFQPDTLPSRQVRHTPAAVSATSQPRGASSYNPPTNPDNMSHAVANYEPRPQMPLTLRPVVTPGNNPVEFARRQRALREHAASIAGTKAAPAPRMMLPGTGFDGPNIYVRCLLALKSGITAEQDYALHHLVKISMERGDKYRFESFLGLAEALIEKALEVSQLFYDVAWEISYLDDGRMKSSHTLDGLEGTADVLPRIRKLLAKDVDDNIQAASFSDRLLQINEAALTIRNMVMLEENAQYVSELYPLRDFLSIALNLPNLECVVELKHYALEIAEQLTKYLYLDAEDPLYLSLLAQLQSEDRGAILTALRAISRISMNLEENNSLRGVPIAALQRILDWTLLDDEELIQSCLDFLYQYTAVVENVDFMINEMRMDPLVYQLVRLLMSGARAVDREFVLRPSVHRSGPSDIPGLPKDLLQTLLKFDEPERSSHWLRCLFDEDAEEAITQIALWQAYQACFTPVVQDSGRPLLPAADFIKNVSTTFAEKATAQVQAGPVQKFIIKGIRIRDGPVDLSGREYTKCLWHSAADGGTTTTDCGEYFMTPQELYDHILTSHVGAERGEDGKYSNTTRAFACSWNGCTRYSAPTTLRLNQFASHLKVHMSASFSESSKAGALANGLTNGATQEKNSKQKWLEPALKQKWDFIQTPSDERGDASGISLSAVLVLRNLARNLPKTESEENAMKDDEAVSLVCRLFKPVEGRLWDIFAHNKVLSSYLADLLAAISD
ncbi:MAG: Chromatin structure-remodeling complex protein rsc9 [Claussenomyces sp. TS43310]|nr:MAG: Chromatin structure-remodeling complex protein rsc9 [Claussenomyces sp. TS43310]